MSSNAELEERIKRLNAQNLELASELERYRNLHAFSDAAAIVATRAYHILGGWKGKPPELPISLGDSEGTMWVGHADFGKKQIKLEAKRHWLREDLPRRVDTYVIDFDAFSRIFIEAKEVIGFSIDDRYVIHHSHKVTPRQILAMAGTPIHINLPAPGKDPETHFVARATGEKSQEVFEDIDEEFELKPGDRFYTVELKKQPTQEQVAIGAVL